jgi:membrane protein DedA with SNARE-associated domain
MAGIARMPYPQFLLCNLGGATVWAVIMVTLSFFLGRLLPLQQLVAIFARFGIVALGLVLSGIVVSLWWESRKPSLEAEK